MRFTNWRLLPLLAIVAAVFVAAGCGDDDGGDDPSASANDNATPASTETPPAKDSPAAFAIQLAKLVADSEAKKACKPVDEINRRSPYQFSCPADAGTRKSLARFEVVAAAKYGTGGVVDYKSGRSPDGASMLTFLHSSGKWAISRFGFVTPPTVGTGDEDNREGYLKTANGYLDAVEQRDCKSYNRFALGSDNDDKVVCRNDLPRTRGLAKLLEANGDATPEYLGGNGTYGFVGLRTEKPKPRAFTISVLKTPQGSLNPFLVLDVVPAPD